MDHYDPSRDYGRYPTFAPLQNAVSVPRLLCACGSSRFTVRLDQCALECVSCGAAIPLEQALTQAKEWKAPEVSSPAGTVVPAISSGFFHTVGLRSDGSPSPPARTTTVSAMSGIGPASLPYPHPTLLPWA